MDTSKQNINTAENDLIVGNTIEIDVTTESNSTQDLWKGYGDYQNHVTITSIDSTNKSEDFKIVYMDDLEKRKEAYGICGECKRPGTGQHWCQSCNAKRFKENFKNWTSGNKDIDELIQQSQLNAVHYKKCLEWVPFENFKNVTYITRGGFGKIYSADWPEGYIYSWDIEKRKWKRYNTKVALKSLDDSSDISIDFLNEIKSHTQIYLCNIVQCYGITQDPNTKDYMIVLQYCKKGNMRDHLNQSEKYIGYNSKIKNLMCIASALLEIHNAGKVHKDLHSGNIIIYNKSIPFISDLGMCQPANNKEQLVKKQGVYGVLPYMAPEVLRGYQYTKAADIYSFGIIMNEYISEETPYNDIPHDDTLAIEICKGLRPKIFKDTPKLIINLIIRCWDAKAANRPTAKELYQAIKKWRNDGQYDSKSEIYSQIKECDKVKENKLLKNRSNENKPKNLQTHPQAIYTSRLLNFKNLPEPVNSTDLSLFQYNDTIPPSRSKPISECLDCQLSELDLNQDDD